MPSIYSQKIADVCIVGGGIQGCAIALELIKQGLEVTVIERDYPGRGSSGINAGGVRRMNRHPAEIPLSLASHKIWETIQDYVDDNCGFSICSNIKIAETEQDLDKIRKRVDLLEAEGYSHEKVITQKEVGELLPTAANDITGALFCAGDGFASPFRTTHAFFKKAQSLGANFILGETVKQLNQKNSVWNIQTQKQALQAHTLVNCAGAWGNYIAAQFGDPTPIMKEAPMMMVTERVPNFLNDVVGLVSRRLSFKQRKNGTLLIGGGYRGHLSSNGNSSKVDLHGLRDNANAVLRLFPKLKDVQVTRTWSGVEAVCPDHLPIISPSYNRKNAFHAFGFSSHGFQLGPIVGKIVSDLITKQSTDMPIKPFNIARFLKH